jgi:4-alpha-glucanotransferase
MQFKRSSGILLHPTSFPGRYGIGDLGSSAYGFIDFLSGAGCKLWQVLPLGPTGYGDSPYQCFSAFAGNPYLVSPELLLSEGLLAQSDLADLPDFPVDHVDFGWIFQWKPTLLDRSYDRFRSLKRTDLTAAFKEFRQQNESWLEDYALFMAIKDARGGKPWSEWPEPLRARDRKALIKARADLADAMNRQVYRQFLFFRQWQRVRAYAHSQGIRIVGDIPIFVAYDSADAWSHPDLFHLDESGQPTVVAGVPPDYFSPTGQLWGNPLYRWDVHKARGYDWWQDRFRATLNVVDIIRLDHFRGFAGYWEVPAGNLTAEIGRWVPGPGADFFDAMKSALGDLPIIAEDLGDITPDVIELRDRFQLPGMKILQFGFSGMENPFLPHHYVENCVVYTGTHDNDTTRGWYESAAEHEKDFARRYLKTDGAHFAWDAIKCVWESKAIFALAPLQDFLNLDTEARMNFPGKLGGNWMWRMDAGALTEELKEKIRGWNSVYNR